MRFESRLALLFITACGQPSPPVAVVQVAALPAPSEDCSASKAYVAAPVWSGRAAQLPAVPTIPSGPLRVGDAFTVLGAQRALQFSQKDLASNISIIGVIVDTNIARAPKCALHPTGKADPPNCITEIPTFTIADDDTPTSPRIRVMGWASNFANVYMATMAAKRAHPARFTDEHWAVQMPLPLPAMGARVRVTGHYGEMFTRASSGVVRDSRNGLMTYDDMQPAP